MEKKRWYVILYEILTRPVDGFNSLAQRNIWFSVFVFSAIITLIISVLMLPKTLEVTLRFQEKILSTNPHIPAESIPKLLNFSRIQTKIKIFISPLQLLITYLILSLIFWGVIKLIGSEELDFKKSISVVSYSYVPIAIGSVVGFLFLVSNKFKSVNSPWDLNLSIGLNLLFNRENITLPLYVLLSKINIFSIWTLYLYILGFSALGKISKNKVAISIILLWLVYIAFNVGSAFLRK